MKRFLKEYTIELIAGGVILFGAFLVVENFKIRSTLLAALTRLFSGILPSLNSILSRISSRAAVLTVSDFLGILMILLAVEFIVWRIRYRFRTNKRLQTDACPKCSGPIRRIHRRWWDRVLGATLLPEARRYSCMDPNCGWRGLMRRHVHHHRHSSEKVSEIENP